MSPPSRVLSASPSPTFLSLTVSSWVQVGKSATFQALYKNLGSGGMSLLECFLVVVDSVYNLAVLCNSESMDTSNEVFNAKIVWFVQTRDQGWDSCANCAILMHSQFSGPKTTAAIDSAESESSIDNCGYSIAKWHKQSPNSLLQPYLSMRCIRCIVHCTCTM